MSPNANQAGKLVPKPSFRNTRLAFIKDGPIVRFYDPNINAKDANGRTLDHILKWDDIHLEHSHDYIQMLFPLPEGSMFSFDAPIIEEGVMTAFRQRADLRQRMNLALNRMLKFYGFEVSDQPPEEEKSAELAKDEAEKTTEEPEADAPAEVDAEVKTDDEDKGVQKEEGATTTASAAQASNTSTPTPTSLLGYYVVRGKNWQEAFRNWAVRMDHNHLRITRILRSLRVLGLLKECEAFFAALQSVYSDPDIRIGERSMMFWERAVKQPLHIAPDGERVAWLKDWEVDKREEPAHQASH
ncbi:hypothetical protein K458DRAFT_42367 [Lentithecium fluviatile CBS 122367]|uniref:Opioid growth factor receptor (OGFr) conserved domain-containing protein n=1 Tax=Lentithecium fluviatile CBS 122367 TaxID=1168545 RepID=A0A6G1J0N4_9PLEO|nr:hypothetical protein K458DRAFT_42367 [Lentithecium fluviatile CBS 122367]